VNSSHRSFPSHPGRFVLLAIALSAIPLLHSGSAATAAGRDSQADSVSRHFEVAEHRDLRYFKGDPADAEKHSLDLYVPVGRDDAPLLLWIHGGAWAVGDRADEARIARRLAEEGIAVAAINYRLSPATWMNPALTTGVRHPAHVIDCARAFVWLLRSTDAFGYDPRKVAIGGYSSGGHLSALLVTDPRYLEAEGAHVQDVYAAVPMAGAYDLAAYYREHLDANGQEMADSHVLGAFGPLDGLGQASPTSFLDRTTATVPMLVVSESDTYEFTRLFESRAKEAGRSEIEFLHVTDKNHNGLYRSLGAALSPTRKVIVSFLEEPGKSSGSSSP